MEFSLKRKIEVCIMTNLMLLICIVSLIYQFADNETLAIGYSDDLIVLGIAIDTLPKYIMLHITMFVIEFLHSIIYEYANPIMYFNIFNDQKKYISDFSKVELQVYAQSLWFLTSIKNGFMLLVSVSQIDITIAKVIYGEIAIAIVIRNILNSKIFIQNQEE